MRIFKGTILFSLLLAAGTIAGCDRNSDRSTTPAQSTQPTQTSMSDEDANTTNAGNLDERRNDTGNTGADSPAGQQGAEAALREGQGTSTRTDTSTDTSGNTGTSTDPSTGTPRPAPMPTPPPTPSPTPE